MADSGDDKGSLVVGVVITTLVLGGIFVFARTITRTIIKPQFSWDDALIVITWFIILGYNSAMFVSVSHGYGKHATDLTVEQTTSTVQAEVIGQVMAIASFPTGKASIAYLILRIFPGRKLRWFLWMLVAGNAIFFYIDAILIVVQCQPVAFQWDHSIQGGSCWDSAVVIDWGFLTGVFGAFTDFTFAILPVFYVIKLQIGLKEKISVSVALSMGIFAAICSILKIYYTSTLGAHTDYTFDTVPLVVWSCVELALINIAACIPALRPLYLWLSGEDPRGQSGKHSGYELRYGTAPRRFGPSAYCSARGAQLESSDDHDHNIYQTRTTDINFMNRKDMQSSTEGDIKGAVATHVYQTL